jgi:hypothetical protein
MKGEKKSLEEIAMRVAGVRAKLRYFQKTRPSR